MQRHLSVVLSFLLLLQLAKAQVHTHNHAHNSEAGNNNISSEYSKDPIRLKNGFFKQQESGKWKIFDANRRLISNVLYDWVDDYSQSVLPVNKGNKWGLLNEKGIQILETKFDLIGNFTTTVSAAKMGNQWFLINNKGTIIKSLLIEHFGGFTNGKAKVYKGNKIAYINTRGDILPPGWIQEKPNRSTAFRTANNISARSPFDCPPNITFENGDFTGWECFIGHVLTRNSDGCVCTDNENNFTVGNPSWTGSCNSCTGVCPPCKNVMIMDPTTSVPPDPNRHLVYNNGSIPAIDPYGLFPTTPPDGSGFAVKLGNDMSFPRPGTSLPNAPNARVERIRYKIKVPQDASEYFIVFQYAVVFAQFSGHQEEDHPRFTARLIDVATNQVEPCADFDFNAFNPEGFQFSPITTSGRVLYKPWERIYVNLSKYADKEVYLEFSTADCSWGGHWGYAYVDVEGCDLSVLAENACNRNETRLSAQSGFLSYTWWNRDFTQRLGEGQNITVSPALQPNDTANLEFVIKSVSGCRDTAKAVITPQSGPSINLGTNKSICNGAQPVTIGVSDNPDYSYNWTSTGGSISNPSQSEITVSPASTTSYTLNVTDNLTGCSSSSSVSVIVEPPPVITVTSNNEICLGKTAVLNMSGASRYNWSPAPLSANPTDSSSAIVSPSETTEYTITGIQIPSGCSTQIKTTVIVNPNPVPNISITGNNNFICEGSSFLLNGSGGQNYQWLLNNNPISGATSSILSSDIPGVYTLKVFSDKGCEAMTSLPINLPVISKPIPDFSAPWGCELKSIKFINNSSAALQGGVRWKWEFGDGNSSNEREPEYIYNDGNIYQVKLTVIPELCPQNAVSITRPVRISSGLSGLRYPTINTTKFKPTPLAARPGAIQYLWAPSLGLNNPQIQNPTFNYDDQTEYLIRFKNQDGCDAVDTLLVKVFNEEDIFVPEAFTPNGDGVNDYLDVFLIGIKEIRFWVFNRWGQLMFETKDPAQRWDGTYAGQKQPLENYVWIAEAITVSGKKIKKRGQSVLIR